jgi:DNA invertase Pin-like site-specific DNA recombinase
MAAAEMLGIGRASVYRVLEGGRGYPPCRRVRGHLRAEKRSGTTTQGREELSTVLDLLRKSDVLMVTRIDRLARSIGDLQDIVRAIRAKGAALKATEQPIDTGTAAGKCFLDMLGVLGVWHCES